MSERPAKKREQEWNDEIPDEENEQSDPYEKTYRDGSLKNECWRSDDSDDETLRFSLDEIRFE